MVDTTTTPDISDEIDRLLAMDRRSTQGAKITRPEQKLKGSNDWRGKMDNFTTKTKAWLKKPSVWGTLIALFLLSVIVAMIIILTRSKEPEKPKYETESTTISVHDPLAKLKGKKSTKKTVVITKAQCPDLSRIRHFGFIYPKAVERYFDVEKEFGRPSHEARGPNGLLLWDAKTLKSRGHFYSQITLRDEEVYHDKPKPHCDFLYATIPYMVPHDKLQDVLALSESVSYDALKRELTARCHFMGANVATLLLATKIATGEATLGKIIETDAYKTNIMATMPLDPKNKEHVAKAEKMYKQMTEELSKRVEKRSPLSARKMDDTGSCAAFKTTGC